ncbi:MAG: hypothetical protein NTW00_16180 [Hyphomicrobiales bacterium]|nr:hypothetical protein [Hyphomicrobiales bacterium]
MLSRTRQIAAAPPGSPLTIRAAHTQEARQMTFVNPASGLDMPTEIVWRSSLAIQSVMTRPGPVAYTCRPARPRQQSASRHWASP